MATLPAPVETLIAQFGPHLNYPPREGYPGRDEQDVAQSYEAGFVAHLIKPVARPGKLSAEHQRETLPFLKSAAKCPLFFRLEVTCAILAQSHPQIRVVSGLDKSSHHRWKALLSRFLLDRQKPSRRISLPVAKVPYPTQVIQSNQKKQLA